MDIKQAKQASNDKLLAAAKSGDAKALLEALQAGADVQAKDSDGWTAAMWAARDGHADCAKLIETERERRELEHGPTR